MTNSKRIRILDLPLKKEWYNMIESGEKKEEYREIKPYWTKRLKNHKYTHVRFRYGDTKKTIMFEIKHITTGIGKQELGAPEHDVYVIRFS